MEDKMDKLLDMMEKMYKDLKGDVRKLQLTQEQMQAKLEQMAEIQQSHYEENLRSHGEIIRRMEKIEVATLENEAEIYNLKKAK